MAIITYTTEDDNCTPQKKYRYDAGWDLRSRNETFTITPGAKIEVNTGIKIGIPRGYVGLIAPRSGLGTKFRIGLANTIGVIDSDYRGEVKVFLVNDGHIDLEVKQYDRICQLLVVPVELQTMRKVGLLRPTNRDEDGFGHSGVA